MKEKNWLKGAVLLGLSFLICVVLIKPIGVSTQFSVLTGIIYSSIDKDVITEDPTRETGYKSTNAYFDKSDGKLAKAIKNPINYDFVFVLAIPLGSYIAYKTTRKDDEYSNINEQKCNTKGCKIEKKGFIREYAPYFIGGFLLLFGARFADGCTSGHMMSGMMQSSVSGYAFAIFVFIVAIPTSMIVKRMKL